MIASLIALTPGQPEGAARLFDGEPTLLHRAWAPCWRPAGCRRRRHAHRHARLRQDHPVLLRRRHHHRGAQGQNISDMRRHWPRHAVHHGRLLLIGSLSIIGLPPMAAPGASGTWRWARHGVWPATMSASRPSCMISSLLNAGLPDASCGARFLSVRTGRRRVPAVRAREERRYQGSAAGLPGAALVSRARVPGAVFLWPQPSTLRARCFGSGADMDATAFLRQTRQRETHGRKEIRWLDACAIRRQAGLWAVMWPNAR